MIREIDIGGVLLAPIMLYAIVALLLTLVLRWAIWRLGVLRWVWHPALVELALFVCVLSLLVLYV